jgi:hypothetical protein
MDARIVGIQKTSHLRAAVLSRQNRVFTQYSANPRSVTPSVLTREPYTKVEQLK